MSFLGVVVFGFVFIVVFVNMLLNYKMGDKKDNRDKTSYISKAKNNNEVYNEKSSSAELKNVNIYM